jgi:XTP/dITP diphosphohydrolase
MAIGFVTTSAYKFSKLNEVWQTSNDLPPLEQIVANTPEIQSDNNHEVAAYSAQWAAHHWQRPMIKEDVGLYLHALGGFPGPYLKHVETWLRTDGLLQLMTKAIDRSAHYQLSIGYCEPDGEPQVFSVDIPGHIITEPRGGGAMQTDQLFVVDGHTLTIAEELAQDCFQRPTDHYQQLIKWLQPKLSV